MNELTINGRSVAVPEGTTVLEAALEIVQNARPVAEILPIYKSSLAEFLGENGDGIGY